MRKISRLLALALTLVMLTTAVIPLTSCTVEEVCTDHIDADSNGKCDECGADVPKDPDDGDDPITPGVTTTYTVQVRSAGGLKLAGVYVNLIKTTDNSLVDYEKTDANGMATFTVTASSDYAIELEEYPGGYTASAQYPVTTRDTVITLVSSPRPEASISGVNYKVGDIIYDFTLTDPDGKQYKLSEIFASGKKAVVLNFWYTTCSWCVQEFPDMHEAYLEYKDDVEILAVNDYAGDNSVDVKDFKESYGLTFPMMKDTVGLYNAFGFTVAPCTVVIDRYGMITVMEAGAVIGTNYWKRAFKYFIADNYEQRALESIKELSPTIKPEGEMPSSDEIAGAFSGEGLTATYHPETNPADAEFSWPFEITTYDGVSCVKPTNENIDNSYATLYATVQLNAGDALMFEYYSSTHYDPDNGMWDAMYIIVDGKDMCTIVGVEDKDWRKACAYVAKESGTYEVAFCYIKDASDSAGDDTVYLKNLHVVDAAEVDVESYIYRYAATDIKDDKTGYNTYVEIFYNETDGYYHVDSIDGPILLANLLGYTNFDGDMVVTERLYGDLAGTFMVDGTDKFNQFEMYCNYASNASLYGYCPVTEELRTYLEAYVEKYWTNVGKLLDDNTWLQLCTYYDAYGTDGKQLADPIKGLASFSAYDAVLSPSEGEKVYNEVVYERVVMPRGYLYRFVPETSGAYRIVSQSASEVNGWIFTGNHDSWSIISDRILYVDSEQGERLNTALLIDPDGDGVYERDLKNCSMTAYMEAGQEYYIVIGYYDVYQFGKFTFTVEYVAPEFELFREASPGPFTYELGPNDTIGNTIAGGIDVVLNEDDGYYYHKIGTDAEGKAILGSKVYADFIWTTNIFPSSTMQQLINNGAFDFSKTAEDHRAIAIYEKYGAGNELKTYWGVDFDANWDFYQMDDIIAGVYHGTGEDYTDEMQAIFDANVKYTDDEKTDVEYEEGYPERQGCVAVDERLAELLQMLMDKFTFRGVQNSWTKLCYYYEHLGPSAE